MGTHPFDRAGAWAALYSLAVACGLEEGGQATAQGDASAGSGGSVSTTGGAWGTGNTGGALDGAAGSVPDAAAGAASGGAASGGGGAAGAAGSIATGGGGGGCSVPGATCTEDSACCSGLCGPGFAVSADDCAIYNKCAECDDDGQCSSGRCDACKCEPKLVAGGTCNEDDDCVGDKCGPATLADSADCATPGKCAECDGDGQCGSGRCDACKCEPKLVPGGTCNEDSDCVSDKCGPGTLADSADCAIPGKCAECDGDGQCGSGRCDACKCEPKLIDGASCNEDSDCNSGWCSGGKCK